MDHTVERPGTAENGVQTWNLRRSKGVCCGEIERSKKRLRYRIRTRRRIRAIKTISAAAFLFAAFWTAGIAESTDLAGESLASAGLQLVISVSLAAASLLLAMTMQRIENLIKNSASAANRCAGQSPIKI